MTQPDKSEVPLAFFFFICLISAELGQLVVIPIDRVGVPAVWPLTGVLVGALILADRRRWKLLIAVAAGAMIISIAILHSHPTLPSVVLAVIVGCEAFAAAWLVQRTTDGPFALNRVAHAWVLVIASMLVPIAGAALASSLFVLSGASPFVAVLRSWWLADALGILVTAPLVTTAIAKRSAIPKILKSWRLLEIATVFAGGSVVAWSIFADALDPMVRVPAYLLPFLLWPVFRFGPGGASAAVLVVSLIGLWNAAEGHGPLVLIGAPAANLIIRSQGAMAIAAVSFLLLASVVAERKRVAQEHAILVTEFQKALAEVKTLRGLIPICAWCHKVRDDAGFWQQIEIYLDARTDATFSHSICPACSKEAQDEIASHAGSLT